MKQNKRCTCGLSNTIFCPNCSMLRMTIMLKNGNDTLKYKRANGQLSNPVWYSHLKYNRMDASRVAEKMENRLKENAEYANAAQVLLFFENGNRHQPIKKVVL